MRTVFALIWKSNEEDDNFDQNEFESRVPALMEWLEQLRNSGRLRACGGGGFARHAGSLTIVEVESESEDEALLEVVAIARANPLNEIGQTDIMVWDLFYSDLAEGWSGS